MRKKILILLTALIVTAGCPFQTRAMDPITMAVLAPMALKAADVAKPYLIRSITNTAVGLYSMGKDAFQMLYFPWGLGEITFGAPFHKFRSGMVHIVRGGIIAPTRFFLHTMLLPVYMAGVNINI